MQRFSLVVLLALFALASANNDLFIGHREPNDGLIEQRTVDVGSLWLTTKKREVTISGDGLLTITRVEAIDIKKKPESAKVHVISGGPGYTYVSLGFESERGHGIHFIVKVYGKRAH